MLPSQLRYGAAVQSGLPAPELPVQGNGRQLDVLPLQTGAKHVGMVHQQCLEAVGRRRRRPARGRQRGAVRTRVLRPVHAIWYVPSVDTAVRGKISVADQSSFSAPVPSMTSSPEMTFPELRKGTASRKFGYHSTSRSSHRRGPAFSILNSLPPVADKECGPRSDVGSPHAASRVGTSASAAGVNPSRYGIDLSYARMGGSPVAGPRKHKSAGSASKGHGSKKHKVRAC